mmetsp:Transcript_17952/g.26571  ORF Transcript_17952/g.26571 Transcript_17952/m.26571 type:complete len:251 (+) Transcript_17952:106-858(+)|eukprot:CAMPEP_0194228864 /NCGR_PEP_ID=MMETSP0156-20130528/43591_1 /TAXON_ID=33649 /ORGANISM="Thalassionema nitzschioides, Strain L26-B" /LENGTH=250 /DNA_ID=CAMNT_0038961387 /DNA_START=87 /DNA_END=839 /DNA_ORIENTATION=+
MLSSFLRVLLVLSPLIVSGIEIITGDPPERHLVIPKEGGDLEPQEEGREFLARNAKKEGVITLDSGLQYKVLKKGSGAFHPTIDSSCSCHYEGRLISGKVFDSSYNRGSPTSFAPNQVIKGWTEAMQLMVEGDKFEMYVPPELAYGDAGTATGSIPGGATLIFKMEILEINGDKVPALTCNATTTENCNEKEQAYITKMQAKSKDDQQKQLDRLTKMLTNKMASDLQDWIDRRIRILQQVVVAADDKTEL